MDIFIFISLGLAFCGYLWWFGHYGAWGAFSAYSTDRNNIDMKEAKKSAFKVNMGFSTNGVWVGGWNTVYASLDNDVLILVPEKWIQWALPPFSLPRTKILEVREERFLFRKRICMKINNAKSEILLPYKIKGTKLFSDINKGINKGGGGTAVPQKEEK